MKKLLLLLFTITNLFFVKIANAQVTTNGGSGLAATYATLNDAITALNTATITSPVVITLAASNPQTAPAGGYEIKAEGTSVNTITFVGNNNTITASNALTAGSLTDALFKIIGGDYITINGFNLTENAANTTTDATTNNMTEWGIALLYTTATNGAQNNTITNCTIDLNRTYQNSFGIYSNSNHSATSIVAGFPATNATGLNSGLTITKTTVTDVNIGIVVMGASTVGVDHDGLTIGGSATDAVTISNFGNTGTFSAYANVLASSTGIFTRYIKNFNISYNNISTSTTGPTAGTLRGINIYAATSATAPSGTFTNNINNNTISITSSTTTSTEEIRGIQVDALTATINSTININNNNFTKLTHAAGGTGPEYCILNSALAGVVNVNNNTFTNLVSSTTGNFRFIDCNATYPAGTVQTVNNNSIVGTFSKTGAGGTVCAYYAASSTPSGCTETQTGNNFSNITLTGATTLELWRNRDGASTASGPIKTISNNTFNNITAGSSQATIMILNASGVGSVIANNTISNVTSTGILIGANLFGNENCTFQNNIITGLSSSGATAVSGIILNGTASAGNTIYVYKNKIYDIQSTNTGGSVNGIVLGFAGTLPYTTVANNLIGDLKAPTATNDVTDVIRGISVISTSTTATYNVYYNTVYLNATSSGTSFSTTGIYHTQNTTATTATLDLRNNIIINNSTANGLGNTVAYRRSAAGFDNYATTSNKNLFYAGTPSATNLIFSDGTAAHQTLAAYQAAVGSGRDAASKTENVSFKSTTGSSTDFLHINNTVATVVDGAAGAIGTVTDDYDGEARSASTPDIGADEFILAVPVTLVNFNGTSKNLVNKLTWATATEINNKGFELQRSANGKDFTSISFVKSNTANGNSNTIINYEWNDKLTANASYYYRLKQIDLDGKFEYSKIVLLKAVAQDKVEILAVYPNPAISTVIVNIGATKTKNASIHLIDMNGSIVLSNKYVLNEGENNIALNLNTLAKGNYIIKVITTDNEVVQSRIVKQ